MTQDLIKRLREIAMLESANDVYLAENSAEWKAAATLEEQALSLDIQAGSIEAVQSANARLAAEIERLRAELEATKKDTHLEQQAQKGGSDEAL